MRRSNGCWTCRLRRKKCDENLPVCEACAALHITCHYDPEKPAWLDGGVRQEMMANAIRQKIKDNAHLRRGKHAVPTFGHAVSVSEDATERRIVLPYQPARELATTCDRLKAASGNENGRSANCPIIGERTRDVAAFGRSDTIFFMFYLEHLLPFLFPFYCPSILEGGRAWVLEMMISSPVVRQATLCQSSYFFSLAQGIDNHEVWDKVLTQTRDAFGVLRHALQLIDGSNITEHFHGAVRILTSIMQVQRFEVAVLSSNNCQAHLNGALALFRQLLDSTSAIETLSHRAKFNAVMNQLGLSSSILPTHFVNVPSAEQSAFRFSSALLILDDIIASTVTQEQPKLYGYHQCLLGKVDGTDPPINLEAVIGCQNWVLLEIGEIAMLDTWKQQCRRAGTLDIMELVQRATIIKQLLESHLTQLEKVPVMIPKEGNSLLDLFTPIDSLNSDHPASQSSLVTRVWAHAALLYLSVVVSGLQPANVDVRHHVGQITELLAIRISPPTLLRTMVWPFCVAGCLAERARENCFRGMVEVLKPASVFGTVRKALEIMENVWSERDTGDVASRDLSTCFRFQGDLVLLV
jgi:hypothetical protein